MSARRIAIVCAAVLLHIGAGCVYKGAKVTEGADLTIGLSVPGSEGAASLTLLEYLSGFRLAIAKDARMTLSYTVAETNDYLGCVHTRVYKTVKASVTPTETQEEPDGR